MAPFCLLSEIKCQFPNKTHASSASDPSGTFSSASAQCPQVRPLPKGTAHCLPRDISPHCQPCGTCCPLSVSVNSSAPGGRLSAGSFCTPRPHRTTRWVPILPLPLSQELQQSSLQSAPNLVPGVQLKLYKWSSHTIHPKLSCWPWFYGRWST